MALEVRGAEAVVTAVEWHGRPAVVKHRNRRSYRHPDLETRLVAERLRAEARLLERAAGAGLPIFGTCAGAILMGKGAERPDRLELVDVEVRRNAYGRQVDSFSADLFLTPFDRPFHGVFIRAPIIENPLSRSGGTSL